LWYLTVIFEIKIVYESVYGMQLSKQSVSGKVVSRHFFVTPQIAGAIYGETVFKICLSV